MKAKTFIEAIALAGFMLGAALAARLAEEAGLIGADVARRSTQVVIGLALAAYANRIPKRAEVWRKAAWCAAKLQPVIRVGAWAMTLAGLAYASLWALTPLDVADVASMGVVVAAMAVTIGFCVWVFVRDTYPVV